MCKICIFRRQVLSNASKLRAARLWPYVVICSLRLLAAPKGGYLRHKTRNSDCRFLTTSQPGLSSCRLYRWRECRLADNRRVPIQDPLLLLAAVQFSGA